MKSGIKRFIYGLLIVLGLVVVLMLIPRAHGFLYPEKPPMGYHFLWSSYLAIGVGLEDIIETAPPIPPDIEESKNIEYKNIDNQSLQLDFYRAKGIADGAPLVVFLHGGGWVKGHRSDMLPLIIDFSRRGYITATVSYRLGPYPNCVYDVSDAVTWLYEHGDTYGYDPDRIALVGASAGAHLAMMAAYRWKEKINPDTVSAPRRIKAVINIFGPVDLTTDFATRQPLANSFIGRPFAEAPEVWKEASPIQYVDKAAPPTMIIQGTSDELVPNDQADILKEKLNSVGVPCVDYRFPLWPHAMILVQRVYDYCIPPMDDFLQKYLMNPDDQVTK